MNSQSESFAALLSRGLPLNSKLYWIIPCTTGLIFIFYIISSVKPYWVRKKIFRRWKNFATTLKKNGVYMRRSMNHGASPSIKPYRIIIIIRENEAKVFSTICKPSSFISQRIFQMGAGMGKLQSLRKLLYRVAYRSTILPVVCSHGKNSTAVIQQGISSAMHPQKSFHWNKSIGLPRAPPNWFLFIKVKKPVCCSRRSAIRGANKVREGIDFQLFSA